MMRVGPQAVNLSCQKCHQTYPAELTNIIDVDSYPSLKSRFLGGDLNVTQCPHCRASNPIIVPILYHDGSKDLCITHVPPQLNLSADQQEKIVGEMLNGLLAHMPSEKVRGYLLQPRSSLTIQNFTEQVLTAEGFSEEDIHRQRSMNELLQRMFQTADAQLDELIRIEDEQIDERFITTVSLLREQMQRNRQAEAEAQIQRILGRLLALSSTGIRMKNEAEFQITALKEVQAAVEELGEKPTRMNIRELAIRYLPKEEIYLETLVSILRPAFDYAFYQELTMAIQSGIVEEKEELTQLREKLLDISERVDQLRQIALDQADKLVSELLSAHDTTQAIRFNLPHIDENFFHALGGQLATAEQEEDNQKVKDLQELQEAVIATIQELVRPEAVLLNELMVMEDSEAARSRLVTVGAPLREELLTLMAELQPNMEKSGDAEQLNRLLALKEAAEQLPLSN